MWRKALPWLALLAALTGSHWLAYRHGKSVVSAAWKLADTTRERNHNAALNDLQQRLRHQEADAARQLLAAETRYQEQRRHAETEKARILADHAAGLRRLSVPIKPAACHVANPSANVGGSSTDPAPRAELSAEAVGFLVGLAAEADAVAIELNRCADRLAIREQLGQP